ncbi:I78 family peptidase inhibitor [Rosenbergiella australiborealis]|uniref:I78 family peptidase inhibitor n=1 Tax=Rosenbergiella australiborealis TaxID=1544696 RepID=UPI001F4E1F92|nr:I78 family peptidase inhibitor [Rosenbergiella australiborealis]
MKRITLFFCLTLCATITACSHTQPPASAQYLPDDDMCSASQFQNYVGKPLTAAERLQLDEPARVIPAYASVSMDFNLHRINFLADKTGIISSVYCG